MVRWLTCQSDLATVHKCLYSGPLLLVTKLESLHTWALSELSKQPLPCRGMVQVRCSATGRGLGPCPTSAIH